MAEQTVKALPKKILSVKATKLLSQFVEKGGTLDFRYAFEDMIAEFDLNPNFSPEAKALFRLELLLHEADEGFRDIREAYSYARDLLEAEGALDNPPDRCPDKNH